MIRHKSLEPNEGAKPGDTNLGVMCAHRVAMYWMRPDEITMVTTGRGEVQSFHLSVEPSLRTNEWMNEAMDHRTWIQ